MDFGTWSPSHTILALFIVVGFIGQMAVYFHRTAQNDKRIARLEERMDTRFTEVLNTMDKRFVEVNQRMGETNQRIDSLRSDMNQGFSDVRSEMSKLNQNHIDHLAHHNQS